MNNDIYSLINCRSFKTLVTRVSLPLHHYLFNVLKKKRNMHSVLTADVMELLRFIFITYKLYKYCLHHHHHHRRCPLDLCAVSVLKVNHHDRHDFQFLVYRITFNSLPSIIVSTLPSLHRDVLCKLL